jgi:hypothetical protein
MTLSYIVTEHIELAVVQQNRIRPWKQYHYSSPSISI